MLSDRLIGEVGAKLNYAYYNVDNYLKIYLSHSTQINISDFEFIAQVSIVLKDWKESAAECQISYDFDKNITRWFLYDGYPNNAKCKFEYTIRANTQVQISGAIFAESEIDYIKFVDDNNNETFIFDSDIWFFGNTDGTDRIIKGEFISDGSIQSIGFEIDVFERRKGSLFF
uniref:Uncharacterized protein n=1 Tax=Panagrolaimus sp. ES5 TaxID=591445 RepID=A0AC34F2W2_9BILA